MNNEANAFEYEKKLLKESLFIGFTRFVNFFQRTSRAFKRSKTLNLIEYIRTFLQIGKYLSVKF